jgi:hypothetical protein
MRVPTDAVSVYLLQMAKGSGKSLRKILALEPFSLLTLSSPFSLHPLAFLIPHHLLQRTDQKTPRLSPIR